jgi:predicted HTH transcriptional regulator
MPTLSKQALRAHITGGESSTVEHKLNAPREGELAERICAMANAQGGLIIFGIKDGEPHDIIGIPASRMAHTLDTIHRASKLLSPPILLEPVEPEVYEIDRKKVVVATIPPSRGPVYQSGGVFWIRRGTLYRDTIGVKGYVDRKIIGGTIQEQIDEAEKFLSQYVPVGARIEGWKRVDLPDYPIEALREAIVNAVVHRDYTRRGESIRVFYYSDRVEIHSPGLLLPGITIEQLNNGDVTSKLRNPVLAGLLRDLPGYMERMGSGVRLMLHEMQAMGLPPPHFREHQEVTVTFTKASEAGTSVFVSPYQEGTLWEEAPEKKAEEFPSTSQQEIIQSKQEARFQQAIRYIQENGSITNGQYRELTGASETTALRDLELLVERGALRIVGKTRGRHYRLP